MRGRSLIFNILVDVVVRTAMVFSLFLLFAGHNRPGGGFVAGLVAGMTLILFYVARGKYAVVAVVWPSPEAIMGIGLALALLSGAAGWVLGGSFLESLAGEVEVPVLGTVKATLALPFDIGVFAVVVGLTAALLLSLGEDEPEEAEEGS